MLKYMARWMLNAGEVLNYKLKVMFSHLVLVRGEANSGWVHSAHRR